MVAYEFTPLEITRCASACLPRRCASTAGAASAPLGFESRYSGTGICNGAYCLDPIMGCQFIIREVSI